MHACVTKALLIALIFVHAIFANSAPVGGDFGGYGRGGGDFGDKNGSHSRQNRASSGS